MLFDSLLNFQKYLHLHPRFAAALTWIKQANLHGLAPGRHALTAGVYAIASQYQSKPAADCFIECHRKFIDIQMVIDGTEKIGICSVSACQEITHYDEEKDFQKLEGHLDFITMKPGFFAVFFPQDGHMPGVQASGHSAQVRKIVLKIPVTI